jgi:hypothetical protein
VYYSILSELENRERNKIQSSSEPFERERILFVENIVLDVLRSLGMSHYLYLPSFHNKRS